MDSDLTQANLLHLHISNKHPESVKASDILGALANELEKLDKGQPIFSSSKDTLIILTEVGFPLESKSQSGSE